MRVAFVDVCACEVLLLRACSSFVVVCIVDVFVCRYFIVCVCYVLLLCVCVWFLLLRVWFACAVVCVWRVRLAVDFIAVCVFGVCYFVRAFGFYYCVCD